MLAQLGNIVFQGLFGPSTFSFEGNEAVYAEHALIGSAPRLQLTGKNLRQLTMEITLNAAFCNPKQTIGQIEKAQLNGDVLPLLLGTGEYIADFVIISAPYEINEAFGDGTIIQAKVNLTIKEYIAYSILEKQQQQARKDAFAVGNKNPTVATRLNPDSAEKKLMQSVSDTKIQAAKIDGLVADFQNNPTQRQDLARRINSAVTSANQSIQDVKDQLENERQIQNKFTALKGAATSVQTAAQGIKGLYPFTNVSDLISANTYMQDSTRTLGNVSTPLAALVAVRKTA